MEQVVTPWKAEAENGKFDYQKLIDQFGVEPITPELLVRFEKVTGHPPHPWMRRGIFFAHRQLDAILDDHEKGKPIFLYSGRGPSSEMHIGHMPSFMFTKWLQDVFNAVVVIQIADDEKYMFKNMNFDDIYKLGFENAKDIIACGFNREKTFIFSNRDYSRNPTYQNIVWNILKHTSVYSVQATFGIEQSMPVGTMLWPCYQSAAAFSASFEDIFGKENVRCLIVYGVDQDPYQRVARDVAHTLGYLKSCGIMMQFLPSLEGTSKMSSTADNNKPVTTIFMNDNPKTIYDKIKKYAFSGGKETLKEHREKGGDLTIDIPYAYLRFFEVDDQRLKEIGDAYASGQMLTSEIKKIVADKVTDLVLNHQKNKEAITEEEVKYYYDLKKFSSKST